MKPDSYMKCVLTVIAVLLSVIAFRMDSGGTASAMGDGCGSKFNPCYIDFHSDFLLSGGGLPVKVNNWPDN